MWNAYLGALGRVPDQTVAGTSETEKVYYARQLDDAAATAGGREAVIDKAQEIAAMLFNSTEYTSVTRTDEQYVRDLYEVYLQRAPDTAGLAQYTTAAGASGGRASVLNTFAGMTAFRELAGTIYREVNWLVTDHLGTPRMVVDRAGSLAGVKRHDYLPFGEEIGAAVGGRTAGQGYGQPNTLRERWATYERDDETGLDFAQARYYSSTQGRFTSPDEFTGGPEELFDFVDDAADNPTFYADLEEPQSLNKYQYAYNNPLRYNDPTGHCPECVQVLRWVIPVVPAIPAAPPIAVVTAIAVIVSAIPGDNTQGDGSCPSCDAYIRNSQQRLEREAAVQRSQAQDNSGNQGNPANQGGSPQPSSQSPRIPKEDRVKPPSRKQRKEVYDQNRAKNGGRLKCEDCGVEMQPARKSRKGVTPARNEATVDHINPRSRGGKNDPDNLRGTCRGCNRDKSDKVQEE